MSKAASKSLLKNVLKGQHLSISAISACGSTGTITLKDDTTTYATLEKASTSHSHTLLGQKSKIYSGGSNLRVEVNIEHISYSISIKQLINCTHITDSSGNNAGCVYTIAIEDSTDNDFNDFVITVLATNK